MKKTLSLVLAVLMALSCFGVLASASNFTDIETNDYADAIVTIEGLGTIDGMTETTFEPNGTLTREQGAAFVCRLLLGRTAADALGTAAVSSYEDVDSARWSSGCIEWCTAQGIIEGDGGKFDPAGKLSTAAWTKLVLCALGYKADVEDYSSNAWAINVAADAMDAGIYDENIPISAARDITRAEACQIVYLALGADGVKYEGGSTIDVGGIKITTGATRALTGKDGLKTWFGATVTYGLIVGNASTGVAGTSVAVATVAPTGEITALAAPTTYKFDSAIGDIGQVVEIYAKSATKVTCAFIVSDTVSVTKAVDTAAKYLKAFGDLSMAAAAEVYNFTANYAAATEGTTITGLTAGSAAAIGTYAIYGGEIVSYVANSAATLEKVTGIGTTLANETIAVTEYGTLNNTAAAGVVNAYDGIAKGDIVLVTRTGPSNSYFYNIEKAATVTATLSATKTDSVLGTGYVFDGVTRYDSDVVSNADAEFITTLSQLGLGKEYVLYLDAAGDIIAAKGVAVSLNYAYLAQFGKISSTNSLGVVTEKLAGLFYFADGTNGLYAIDTTTAGTPFYGAVYSSATATESQVVNVNVGGVYNVTINAKTKVATAAAVANAVPATGTTENDIGIDNIDVKTGISIIATSGTGKLYADASSVVFYVTGTYNAVPALNTLVVAPVTGIANFVTKAAPAFTAANYKTNAAGQKVLTVAVASGSATVTTPEIVFFTGAYNDQSVLDDGETVTTRTYEIYKNGVKGSVDYEDGAITVQGFYTTGADDLIACTGAHDNYVHAAAEVADLFGNTLTLADDATCEIGSATIIDVTPASQTYTSLVEAGKTVKVAVEWTTNVTTTVHTATNIFVVAVTDAD